MPAYINPYLKDKYINPFTDFGFKKLFGEEPNKALLISFLNTLLPAKHQIQDFQYIRDKHQGASSLGFQAIFDIRCISTSGERFIVELQKAKQNYFQDRSTYYSSFPIKEYTERGQWDFKLNVIYTVGVLDFVFDEDRAENDFNVIHTVQLKNQKGELFYDKLTFIYLTLPNFTKNLDELETMQDKWFYALRHLPDMESVPPIFQDSVFQQLFETAKIACFNLDERQAYESSLKYYRDLKNVMDTAKDEAWNQGHVAGHEKGRTEGLEEGSQQAVLDIARNLLDILDDATIAEKTGLTLAEIAHLRVKD